MTHNPSLYNNLKSKPMYSRCYEFNNMDLISCQDLDHIGSSSPNFKKPLDPTTLGNDEHDECDFLYQKSDKNITSGYEISFEKGFMKEHQTVYERQLQNFMESFGIPQKKNSNECSFDAMFTNNSANNFNSIQDVIRSQTLNLTPNRIQNFCEKLMTYDKLEEFLDIVVGQTQEPILFELVSLTEKIVEKYESVRIEEPSESELLEMACEIARSANLEHLTSVKGVSALAPSALKEKAKRLVEVYCATAILVTAQYFVNPYTDEEIGCLKRPLSPWSREESEEEEENYQPSFRKFRKFSF